MNILSLYNVTKELSIQGANNIPILKNISFDIKKGEFVAITGPSGSGKSTLLYLLGGLDSPTTGEIIFDGKDFSKMSDDQLTIERNQKIGFVYQFHYLLPEFSALENVMMPLLASEKMKNKEARKKAEDVLNLVGLSDRLNYYPKQLSGGQQQRVSIARALSNSPSILFGDEPTGNLDTKNSHAVYSLFRELNQKFGQTIVVVTHDPLIAEQADRQIHIIDGEIEYDKRNGKSISNTSL